MKYEFFLVFLKNKSKLNPLSWLIRFAQKTEYNHVEVMVRTKGAAGSISYGAVWPESRKIGYGKLFEKYDLVKFVPVNINIDQYEAIKILNDLCGKPYSLLQLIVILAKISFHGITAQASKVKLNLDKFLICTELASIFLSKAKGAKFDSEETVTLKELDKDWS